MAWHWLTGSRAAAPPPPPPVTLNLARIERKVGEAVGFQVTVRLEGDRVTARPVPFASVAALSSEPQAIIRLVGQLRTKLGLRV